MPYHEFFPESARSLLAVKGSEVVARFGRERIVEILGDLLTGANVRAVTEALTRDRTGHIAAAIVQTFVRANAAEPGTVADRIADLVEARSTRKLSQADRWIVQWPLGLTDKQFQNVIRSDYEVLAEYAEAFETVVQGVAEAAEETYGELSGTIRIGADETPLDWPTIVLLATALGQQTLTIRGSEKSLYGKLFEKLVLTGLLHSLGFEFQPGEVAPTPGRNVFWLTTREEKRESDATALIGDRKAIRFDIGFIGIGNPELLLDKVSRFARHAEFDEDLLLIKTIIIGDRISENGRIVELARAIDGEIVEMSRPTWVLHVADALERLEVDFHHELDPQNLEGSIRARLRTLPYDEIFTLATEVAVDEADG